LNLRGSDIPYNPVFFAYAAVSKTGVNLFIDKSRFSSSAVQQLKNEGVDIVIQPYVAIEEFLRQHVEETKEGRVWLSSNASFHLHSFIPDNRRVSKVTPTFLAKMVKNPVEQKGEFFPNTYQTIVHFVSRVVLCP